MFDIDDTDLPVSGMSFARSSDMVVGQVVQIEPTSALVSGTLQPLNTNHVRLMKTWMTAKVASTANAETFTYAVVGPAARISGAWSLLRVRAGPADRDPARLRSVLSSHRLVLGGVFLCAPFRVDCCVEGGSTGRMAT